jgi:hypothetical protein
MLFDPLERIGGTGQAGALAAGPQFAQAFGLAQRTA